MRPDVSGYDPGGQPSRPHPAALQRPWRRYRTVHYLIDYPAWGCKPAIGHEIHAYGRAWQLVAIKPLPSRSGEDRAVLTWQSGAELRTSSLKARCLSLPVVELPKPMAAKPSKPAIESHKNEWYLIDYRAWNREPEIGDEVRSCGKDWCLVGIKPHTNRFGGPSAILLWQAEDEYRTSGLKAKSLQKSWSGGRP